MRLVLYFVFLPGYLLTFTCKAVNESTEYMLLNALDHRAAAYEKLMQLQSALKDAKRMIEVKPEASNVCMIVSLGYCLFLSRC